MERLYVGPSKYKPLWADALHERNDDVLEAIAHKDAPGAALFELEGYVNGVYRMAQRLGMDPADVSDRAQRVVPHIEAVRLSLGPRVREFDLTLMRWVRRSSALSPVLGAGATMDAGGPSWAGLVRFILSAALTTGHEVRRMANIPTSDGSVKRLEWETIKVERFTPEQEAEARRIIARIDDKSADTPTLMRGAEMCVSLFGQHLFTLITDVLYDKCDDAPMGRRTPGPIHRAVAELADHIPVPDRGPGLFPGWDSIITYNFDDLMGEALDDAGLPRAAWAMRGNELAGDPNEAARKAGQNAVYQPIYHVHGYTPRRFFLITNVKYVLADSQYTLFYSDLNHGVLGKMFQDHLAHPIRYGLYIGCSFTDEAMNNVLRRAAERLPGRYHYAMLQWPGPGSQSDADGATLRDASARYTAFGVRPVWFDRFDEIPAMIRSLR